MKCEDCKYFEKPDPEPDETPEECEENYEFGDCHRFPAHIKPNDYGFNHPNMFRDDWCGEYVPKEEEQREDLPTGYEIAWRIAEKLGTTEIRIRKWGRGGKIPSIKLPSGELVFNYYEVVNFLKKQAALG